DAVNLALHHPATRPRVRQPDRIRMYRQRVEGIAAAGVAIENFADQRTTKRVDVDSVGFQVVDVPDRRHAGPVALLGLLPHPLLDLFAQVVDVVLRHQDFDAVHKLVGRARVLGDDDVLFDEHRRHARTLVYVPGPASLAQATQDLALFDRSG